MNPFYNGSSGQPPMMNNNPMNFIQRFNQFRQTFQGNPEEQVKQLLQSGRMTQEQYQQYKATAEQMMQFFTRR